jgi:GT2 family glycosyltransferase
LIPVKDGASTIARAITSVLTQADSNWRLIVGDNASTDGTEGIARAFEDPRILLVRWDEPVGIFENFERTYRLGHGEWVFLLPADDQLSPRCLARIREVVDEQQPSRPIAAVLTRAARVDLAGQSIETTYYGTQGVAPVPAGVYDAAGWLATVCRPGSPPWDGGAFRREAVDAVGAFFRTDIPSMSADLELIIRIATVGDVAYIDEPLMTVTGSETSHTPGRVRRNLERREPFTPQGIALAQGLLAHERVRRVSAAERRAVHAAIARTHLRRATAHRIRPGGQGRRAALTDVLHAARLSPVTVVGRLALAAALVIAPTSTLVRIRERALRHAREADHLHA